MFKDRTESNRNIFIAMLASFALVVGVGCDNPQGAEADAPTAQPTPKSAGQMQAQGQPSAETDPKAPTQAGQPTERAEQQMPDAPREAHKGQQEARPSGANAPGANQRGQQARPGANVPPGAATAGAKVTDDDLKAFVELAPRVQKLENTYRTKMNEAESAEEANKIRQEAHSEVQREFADSSLAPDDFSSIAARITADPELQKRAQKLASK